MEIQKPQNYGYNFVSHNDSSLGGQSAVLQFIQAIFIILMCLPAIFAIIMIAADYNLRIRRAFSMRLSSESDGDEMISLMENSEEVV